jgi:hypothetical protein
MLKTENYQVVNGTFYHKETPKRVVIALEFSRQYQNQRLVIFLGDGKTGKAWGDIEEGRIGRSTGEIKIPLIISNSRSLGGSGLLDHCIVKILAANGKTVIYRHENYNKEGVSFNGKNAKYA